MLYTRPVPGVVRHLASNSGYGYYHMNEKLNHLKWILLDQVVDLTTATTAIKEHMVEQGFNPVSAKSICYFRMCMTSLIVSLSKLWEALDHYNQEINNFPEELKLNCRALKAEIERRKIYQFRSKYAAHIIDNKTKKPLSLKEGEQRYFAIAGKSLGELIDFCEWVAPKDVHGAKISVMHTVVTARDYCMSVVGSAERP